MAYSISRSVNYQPEYVSAQVIFPDREFLCDFAALPYINYPIGKLYYCWANHTGTHLQRNRRYANSGVPSDSLTLCSPSALKEEMRFIHLDHLWISDRISRLATDGVDIDILALLTFIER